MKRIRAFSMRNLREMLRDPLSYIFCLGFPLVMLIILTLVNRSIPPEAGQHSFEIQYLTPAIAVFGQTFVMLFTALTVSHDRGGAFLLRLYATPMKAKDFVLGYIFPMLLIAFVQSVITFCAGKIIAVINGDAFSAAAALAGIVSLLPSALMYISLGLLFGTLFTEKSAPGLCSVIISLNSFLGCVFFDADAAGGIMLTICKCLPFYYCTRTVRSAFVSGIAVSADTFWIPLLITVLAAVIAMLAALYAFSRKMLADLG